MSRRNYIYDICLLSSIVVIINNRKDDISMKETDILKQMGERIYHRRKLLKLTQEELAERMSVSTQMISNLELGKKAIRPQNLIKLCDVLNVSADYILTGVNRNLTSEEFFRKFNSLTQQELRLITEILDYMNHNKNSSSH